MQCRSQGGRQGECGAGSVQHFVDNKTIKRKTQTLPKRGKRKESTCMACQMNWKRKMQMGKCKMCMRRWQRMGRILNQNQTRQAAERDEEGRDRERERAARLIGIYSWHSAAAESVAIAHCKFSQIFNYLCKFNEPKPFALRRVALRCPQVPHYVICDGPLRTWVTLSVQSFTRAALSMCLWVCVWIRLRLVTACQGWCLLYIFHNH